MCRILGVMLVDVHLLIDLHLTWLSARIVCVGLFIIIPSSSNTHHKYNAALPAASAIMDPL